MASAPILVTMLSAFTPATPPQEGIGPPQMRNRRNIIAHQTPFMESIMQLLGVIRG